MLTFAVVALVVAALLIVGAVVGIVIGRVIRYRDTQVPREDDDK
jgi:heme/copper-type cytochrome/quinol oxidase subunit 2